MSSATLADEDKAQYIPVIDAILKTSDLSTISIKKVRNGLTDRTGIDFTQPQLKRSIDTLITDRFDILLNERDKAAPEVKQEGPDADADADAEADEDEGTPKAKTEVKEEVKYEAPSSSPEPSYSATGSASPFAGKKRKSSSSVDEDARLAAELHAELNGGRPSRGTAKAKPGKKAAAKKRATKKKSSDTIDDDLSGTENGEGQLVKKKRKANPNNAFMKPLILSEPLAMLVGEAQLSRPEVVKRIWQHIKSHDLQDPTDRRFILCDDSMKPVFGDKVHMFTMNKVLATNMFKAEEVAQPQQEVKAETEVSAVSI